jgi:hypothetical protein
MQTVLKDPQVSRNSGNRYFSAKLDGDVNREIRVVFNPRWKAAQDEAIATQSRNKQPTFSIIVTDMDRATGDYNGTGSVWMRRKGLHTGSFVWNGKQYTATINRDDDASDFVLKLDEVQEVEVNDL